MPKKSAIISNEDSVLWQRVTSQVKPLKSNSQSAKFPTFFSDTTQPQKRRLNRSLKSQKELTTDIGAMPPITTVTKIATSKHAYTVDLRFGEKAGIDGGTQRRLFRGEVPVDSRLDLHGMTTARAHKQLTQFIETKAYQGCRCVLVITGKGSGVLRGSVPNWLKQTPLSVHVLALAEAKPKDGGSGALYVLLRRKRGGQ